MVASIDTSSAEAKAVPYEGASALCILHSHCLCA